MEILEKTFVVASENSAKTVGSGNLEVLATPIMVAWMENTAMTLAASGLNDGETTVGTRLEVNHSKASGIGETICCKAELTATEGRKISFKIIATDSNGDIIGDAIHERFVVNSEKFMSRIVAK